MIKNLSNRLLKLLLFCLAYWLVTNSFGIGKAASQAVAAAGVASTGKDIAIWAVAIGLAYMATND